MGVIERALTVPHDGVRGGACEGFLAAPARGGDTGVLVLAGSSGRIEDERCRILAREGLTALSVRWFGGAGQPPGICEVPLETFVSATGLLRSRGARRIGVLGTSKGAEAALDLSVLHPGTDAVVALSRVRGRPRRSVPHPCCSARGVLPVTTGQPRSASR
ncbi:hypothetical protein [Streptomyces sp. NPDC056227]|uniref:hypothetical protein n=1 Tax=Streptomyces sp. NPDC056227 TaxID=3345753 RepID=UPI0035D9EC39